MWISFSSQCEGGLIQKIGLQLGIAMLLLIPPVLAQETPPLKKVALVLELT